jgi:ribosomal protein L33
MAKYCPVCKGPVLYLQCLECDDKECLRETFKKNEKQNEKQLDINKEGCYNQDITKINT